MASHTPKPGPKSNHKPISQSLKVSRCAAAAHNPPEVVDPVWLLKAIGLTLVAALICGYLTLCLLFYQGQWQLVLHPSRSNPAPQTIGRAPFESIRFGVDETGAPQLAGWWLAAAPGARYASYTVLYLPSGDGSLADATRTLAVLHEIGINVLAFDYRGYGQSAAIHPNQRRMTEDAASAWQYLTVSRALASAKIIPFGDGVGTFLATQLAAAHTEIPAVILESPRQNLIQVVLDDPRTPLFPVRLLFHDRFEIADPLRSLPTPKLFLVQDVSPPIGELTSSTARPLLVATMSSADWNGKVYQEQVARFLDQYLR